jgi:hypothetical protein
VYHLLCGNPTQGVRALEALNQDWASAYPAHRYALAAVLKGLEETALVHGVARAWTLLVIGWARDMGGDTAQLGDLAIQALPLARENDAVSAEKEAQCLLGGARWAQGRLDEAQAADAKYLAISQRLAALDASHAGWQHDLSVAYSKIDDVRRAQVQLDAA